SRSMSLGFIRHYIGGANPRDPLVSPVYGDFDAGYPPSVMTTGTRDFNMSGSLRLNEKLTLAGARTALHIAAGMWHGFNYQPDLPEAIGARNLVNEFLLRALQS